MKLRKVEAKAYSEQLHYLQTSLEESESHHLKAESKERVRGEKHWELLDVGLECLKEKLANYQTREEGQGIGPVGKKLFLKSPKFFDLLAALSAFLLDQGFKGLIQQFQVVGYPQL